MKKRCFQAILLLVIVLLVILSLSLFSKLNKTGRINNSAGETVVSSEEELYDITSKTENNNVNNPNVLEEEGNTIHALHHNYKFTKEHFEEEKSDSSVNQTLSTATNQELEDQQQQQPINFFDEQIAETREDLLFDKRKQYHIKTGGLTPPQTNQNDPSPLTSSKNSPQQQSVTLKCKNTVQGKHWITDSKGYTCKPMDLNADSQCCNAIPPQQPYSCKFCNEYGCCTMFEFCVSCCMNPKRRKYLKAYFLKHSSDLLYRKVKTVFEFCMTRCRTSSKSLKYENSYSSEYKHCYGYFDAMNKK